MGIEIGAAVVSAMAAAGTAYQGKRAGDEAKGAAKRRESLAKKRTDEEERKRLQSAQAIRKRREAVKEDVGRPDVVAGRLGLTTPAPTADKKLLGV